MAKDLNKAMFTGRLGADPYSSKTANGSDRTMFRIASNQEEEGAPPSEWVQVITWAAVAVYCGRTLRKGMRVYVEGRLQQRRNSPDHSSTLDLVAHEVMVIDDLRRRPDQQPAGFETPPEEERPIASGTWKRDQAEPPQHKQPPAGISRTAHSAIARPTPPAFKEEDLPL